MQPKHNNFPSSKKKSSVVTRQEFLRLAAEALEKLSPEDKAQVRQRVLAYLQDNRR